MPAVALLCVAGRENLNLLAGNHSAGGVAARRVASTRPHPTAPSHGAHSCYTIVTASTLDRRRATLAAFESREVQVGQSGPTRVLLVMVLAIATTGVGARGAGNAPVRVSMAISADLPAAARRPLVQEAESIWRDAGVHIQWVDESGSDTSPRTLRVVVDRRPDPPGHGGNWVVGELLRFDDGAALATVSIRHAEAIVQAAGTGAAYVSPDSVVQHRLGVVLGRALAHEIGHYLRESGAHASQGLMRANFQPREFTDLRSGTFEVDDASRRLIHQRLRAADRAEAPLILGRSSF